MSDTTGRDPTPARAAAKRCPSSSLCYSHSTNAPFHPPPFLFQGAKEKGRGRGRGSRLYRCFHTLSHRVSQPKVAKKVKTTGLASDANTTAGPFLSITHRTLSLLPQSFTSKWKKVKGNEKNREIVALSSVHFFSFLTVLY